MAEVKSFTLTWRNGAYYVSKPNIDTCEVVRKADHAERVRVLREALKKAEIGLMCCAPLSGYDPQTLHIVRAALTD